jgi:predicted nucleic acid-binding protein
MLVIDASFLIAYMLEENYADQQAIIRGHLIDNDLIAPRHLQLELLNSLTVNVRRKRIIPFQREALTEAFFHIDIDFFDVLDHIQANDIAILAD